MNITFIGGGNMATAIIGGLLQRNWDAKHIRVVEIVATARDKLAQTYGVQTFASASAEALQADCVVLAIKPQQMREAAAQLAPLISHALVITIAAGIRGADLSRWLGNHQRIVRVMPNTPALVLAGISGLYAMPGVTETDRASAANIMGAVGETVWVEFEADIDAVTAVSGSGPAYVFYFIESLIHAGVGMGLDENQARQLAIGTVVGAAALAQRGPESPQTLREKVTSQGGTTHAAHSRPYGAMGEAEQEDADSGAQGLGGGVIQGDGAGRERRHWAERLLQLVGRPADGAGEPGPDRVERRW